MPPLIITDLTAESKKLFIFCLIIFFLLPLSCLAQGQKTSCEKVADGTISCTAAPTQAENATAANDPTNGRAAAARAQDAAMQPVPGTPVDALAPAPAPTATTKPSTPAPGNLTWTPNITIGRFQQGKTETISGKQNILGEYIAIWYKFLVGIAGLLAMAMIIFGGVSWLMSGGSSSAIGDAKKTISSALIGLTLALLSYVLLEVVNPNLVSMHPLSFSTINFSGDYQIADIKVGSQETSANNPGGLAGLPAPGGVNVNPTIKKAEADITAITKTSATNDFRPNDTNSNHNINGMAVAVDFPRNPATNAFFNDLINKYKLGNPTWEANSRDGNKNGYDLANVTINGNLYPVVRVIDEVNCWHFDIDPSTSANFKK